MPAAARILALWFSLLYTAAALAVDVIEVIPLQARTPEELIPVLQPLVAPGGTVTAMGSRLVIKAEPQQLAQIRSILTELDRPPRPLLIEVRVGTSQTSAEQAAGARGRVRIARSADEADVDAELQARLRAAQTRRAGDIAQQLRTVEGRPAFIDVGQQVPVSQPDVQIFGGAVIARDRIEYRPATTGFYVVPWVRGDTVTLNISQHADRFNPQSRGFEVQRADTTVSGPLGSWITLATSSADAAGQARGSGIWASTSGREDRVIEVRVTDLDRRFPVK
jgi:type II secretory pathway component GspD/PulD (secretin)